MGATISGKTLKAGSAYQAEEDKRDGRKRIKRQLGDVTSKTWGALSNAEKDVVNKAVAISLGLVKPDP